MVEDSFLQNCQSETKTVSEVQSETKTVSANPKLKLRRN